MYLCTKVQLALQLTIEVIDDPYAASATLEVHLDGSIDLSCNLRGTLINVASRLLWKSDAAALYTSYFLVPSL